MDMLSKCIQFYVKRPRCSWEMAKNPRGYFFDSPSVYIMKHTFRAARGYVCGIFLADSSFAETQVISGTTSGQIVPLFCSREIHLVLFWWVLITVIFWGIFFIFSSDSKHTVWLVELLHAILYSEVHWDIAVYVWFAVWSDAEDSRSAWCTTKAHAWQCPKGWPVLWSTTRWVVCAKEVKRGKSGMKFSVSA